MAGELSRVTVVGQRKRVDVAVPSATPIGEYTARLARLCGQERDPVLPPAWSLAAAGEEPLPLDASLAELHVSDGQVLYLRDLNREPTSAPIVEDIEELVATETLDVRKKMAWRGPATAAFGLMWMVATAVWLDLHPTAGSGGAIGLTILALVLVGLAWALGQRGMSMARPMRLAIALTSVPCLGAAGAIVAEGLGGSEAKLTGIISGATLAALISVAAIADPILAVIFVHLTAASAVFAILLAVGANGLSAAGFVVLVGMGIFGLVRRTAASMTAFAARAMRTRSTAAGATAGMVHETGWLLALLLVFPAAAITVALPILTNAGGVFALGLAAVASIGALARSWLASFTAEMLVYSLPGVVGMFCLVNAVASMMSLSGVAHGAVLIVAALAIVGTGVGLSLYGPTDPTVPSEVRPPRRRLRAEILNMLCNVLAAPLAMGVFGMLGDLVDVGRDIF